MCILYYSLLSPYIMYCADMWGNTYGEIHVGKYIWGNTYGEIHMGIYICSKLETLSLVTKEVVRLICGAQKLDHSSSLFYDFRILKLLDMVKLKTV